MKSLKQQLEEALGLKDEDVMERPFNNQEKSFYKTSVCESDDPEGEDKFSLNGTKIFQSASTERAWLKKHGKRKYIDFEESELQELRKYFNSLDEDGSGSIGVDELQDPLIALGLAETREEVQSIIDSVDEDGSHQIEFNEFLSIIKGGRSNEEKSGSQAAIYKFFKDMTRGELTEKDSPNMPFRLFISYFRRRKLLDAMMAKDGYKKEKGERVLKAYSKQLATQKLKSKLEEKGETKDSDVEKVLMGILKSSNKKTFK